MKVGDRVRVLPVSYLLPHFHGEEGVVLAIRSYTDHRNGIGYSMVDFLTDSGKPCVLPQESFEVVPNTFAKELEEI